MFRVKICGVTTPEDAAAAVAAGADAIGLNFYAKSSRHVTFERAGQIASAIAGSAQLVGVFVNSYKSTIERAIHAAQLTGVQLHGDETPEALVELKAPRILRAFRCSQGWVERACHYLDTCRRLGRLPDAVLLDAPGRAGSYGGTGESIDWRTVPEVRVRLNAAAGAILPLLLAGGLKPENVTEAIHSTHADGVDVASGVETKPGEKATDRVRDFVAKSHAAFANLNR